MACPAAPVSLRGSAGAGRVRASNGPGGNLSSASTWIETAERPGPVDGLRPRPRRGERRLPSPRRIDARAERRLATRSWGSGGEGYPFPLGGRGNPPRLRGAEPGHPGDRRNLTQLRAGSDLNVRRIQWEVEGTRASRPKPPPTSIGRLGPNFPTMAATPPSERPWVPFLTGGPPEIERPRASRARSTRRVGDRPDWARPLFRPLRAKARPGAEATPRTNVRCRDI